MITVGIPTVNGPSRLQACLESIFREASIFKHGAAVLVLDDGSTPDNLEQNKDICSKYGVNLLMHGERLGVPTGWNNLTRHYECEICVLLNDDVQVGDYWLDALVYSLRNNPGIGVVGLNAYENVAYVPIVKHAYAEGKLLHGSLGAELLSVKGHAFGFRRTDFDEVGGFDQRYFCFFEEVDFCLSIMAKLNKRCVMLNYPAVYHLVGQTTTRVLEDAQATLAESRKAFEAKWECEWHRLRDRFPSGGLPPMPAQLREWNTNISTWV